MSERRLKIVSIFIFIVFNVVLWAAPHVNQRFDFVQPDGNYVPVIVNGDEFHQRVEDLNGRTLVRDSDGWICYAYLNSDSTELLPGARYTGVTRSAAISEVLHIDVKPDEILRRVRERQNEMFGEYATRSGLTPTPVVGKRRGVTILIDFPDQRAIIGRDEVETLINGRARQYFLDVSGGKLDYTNEIVGYYTARNNKSYYDRNQRGDQRVTELLNEALDWFARTHPDVLPTLSQTNRQITAVNFFYAGSPSHGWANGLWPHMNFTRLRVGNSGYTTNGYQITNLDRRTNTIGTFVHENGHLLLRYPDLYPYNQGGTDHVGIYDVMGAGGHGNTPAPPNPYFRAESGWLQYEDITDYTDATVTLTSNNMSEAVQYRHPTNRDVFFVLESIQKRGWWSHYAPGSGMIAWKVNKRGDNMQSQTRLNVEVAGFSSRNSAAALMSNRPEIAFSAQTTPAATWIRGIGGNSNLVVRNLSAAGAQMTFDIGNGGAGATKLTLKNPNAGDTLVALSNYEVRWESEGEIENVRIEWGHTGGNWSVVEESIPNTGIYSWTLPDTTHNSSYIRVLAVGGNAVSRSEAFVIVKDPARLTLENLKDGDTLIAESVHEVIWSTEGEIESVRVEWGHSGGRWSVVEESIPNSGSYSWVVPDTAHASSYLRILAVGGDAEAISEPFVIAKLPTYTLTLNAENGSITADPSLERYPAGAEVRLTAVADSGYTFSSWSGSFESQESEIVVIMDSSLSMTANFEVAVERFTITINSKHGDVSIDPIAESYLFGDTLTVVAQPSESYYFTGWGGDISGFDDTLILVVESSLNIDAYFDTEELFNSPLYGLAGGNRATHETLSETFYAYGYSGGVVDTSNFRGYGGIELLFTVPQEEDESIWPGVGLGTYVSQSCDGLRSVRVTYRSDYPLNVQLVGEVEGGSPYLFEIPASDNFKTVDIPLYKFEKASWGSSWDLDPSLVKNVTLSPVCEVREASSEGVILISSLYLIGVMDPKETSLLDLNRTVDKLGLTITSSTVSIMLPTAGAYSFELYSLNGRKLYSVNSVASSAGIVSIPLQSSIARSVVVARLTSGKDELVRVLNIR